jgi:hypothetical protein
MLEPLYIGEPNTIFVTILDDDNDPVTNATATFTLKDLEGEVIGTAEDVAMAYVAARERYEGTLLAADADELEEDTEYHVWITAAGYTLRRLERVAKYREET